MDLRCEHKLHGVHDDPYLEVKCSSKFCGAGKGVVVIHRFNLEDNTMQTKKFREPRQE